MEKDFKKEFKKIDISDEELNIIKNNIYTKYKKNQRNKKIILSVVTCFIIILSSLGIVYADEIKETINKLIVGKHTYKKNDQEFNSFIVETDVRKVLNYDSKLEEEKCHGKLHYKFGDMQNCYTSYTKSELEKSLNIKLLISSKNNANDLYLYRLERNEENKIAQVVLRDKNIQRIDFKKDKFSDDDLYIESDIIMKTKYYKNSEGNADEYYILGIPKDAKEEKYYIKNLKVNASIVEKNQYQTSSKVGRITAFIYEDIIYVYYFESMTNNNDLIDEQVKNFLDSLTYLNK